MLFSARELRYTNRPNGWTTVITLGRFLKKEIYGEPVSLQKPVPQNNRYNVEVNVLTFDFQAMKIDGLFSTRELRYANRYNGSQTL